MAGAQSNNQREMQLVSEWLSTLSESFIKTTHIRVGAQNLIYGGPPLSPAQAQRFASWQSWCDARVVTASEVWIVEGKLIATGGAYGQVLDYVNDYPLCADAQLWPGRAIIPVVVAQATEPRTQALFASMGVRTILFEPSWTFAQTLEKVFSGGSIDLLAA